MREDSNNKGSCSIEDLCSIGNGFINPDNKKCDIKGIKEKNGNEHGVESWFFAMLF